MGKPKLLATIPYAVAVLAWSRDGRWVIVKQGRAGTTDKPDSKTGWHTFHREGIAAVSVDGGRVVTLKPPDEETNGIDWVER
jgi:hypothetical protein